MQAKPNAKPKTQSIATRIFMIAPHYISAQIVIAKAAVTAA
jgi:hypothetical protein